MLKPQASLTAEALSSCSNSGCIAMRAGDWTHVRAWLCRSVFLKGLTKTIQTGFMKTILLVEDDAAEYQYA